MAAMEDERHECSIRPITDTGVKKTILCKSDWAKIAKYGQVLKTSTRFRPYGTAVQLPIRGKAKVYLKAKAGAVIATYVYIWASTTPRGLASSRSTPGGAGRR